MIPIAFGVLPLHAQVPKFDVASIKLCRNADTGGVARSGTSGGPAPEPATTGRLSINCESLKNLIWYAWDIYANGPRNLSPLAATHLLPPIEGGPSWLDSDRYRIDAKPETAATPDMMRGPMLQALLEDRFQLKIHRASREVPAYALTVAKGGPRLSPFHEGECLDLSQQAPNGKTLCGRPLARAQNPASRVWDIPGTNAAGLANTLQRLVNRPVVDKTAIAGVFDIHLEFGLDENISPFLSRACSPDCGPLPAAPDPAGPPSIFTALQEQLGLKLEPVKGAGEVLVIDRVERPSEN